MSSIQLEKTKVFISSAMREADDVDWPTLRQDLFQELSDDEQFQPFAIENTASSIPSMQFFLSQVEQADYVVCMIGKELRSGTNQELRLAFKLQKHVLLFFIGNEQEDDAQTLKMYVQRNDFCCYRVVDSIDGLPSVIIANLKSDLTNLSRQSKWRNAMAEGIPNSTGYRGLPRETFSYFGNAKRALFVRLGLEREATIEPSAESSSPLERLGEDAIEWLLDGKPFSMASHDQAIKDTLPELAENEEAWGLRAACGSALHGDFGDAYGRLERTLDGKDPSPGWQLGVALVDLRNYAWYKGNMEEEHKAQDRIDALPSTVTFPACEHYINLANGCLQDIEKWSRSLSLTTRGFNNKYQEFIDSTCNALFIAVLYGSYSRMCWVRGQLSNGLADLARVYKEPLFIFQAIRLCLVGGDCKTARALYKSDWQLLTNIVSARADDLWKAAELCTVEDASIATRCTSIELFAPYFTDASLPEVVSFLEDDGTRKNNPSKWSKALRGVSMRLESNALVNFLITMLVAENTLVMDCFDTVLSNIKWDAVTEDNKRKFSEAFTKHWRWYLKEGRSAEPIGMLIAEGVLPNAFVDEILQTLKGVARVAFEGALNDWADYGPLFSESVREAEEQFDTNNTEGVYTEFARNPYLSITYALAGEGAGLLESADGKRLLALFTRAAQSEAKDEVLSPLVDAMASCIAVCKKNNHEIPSEIIDAAGAIRYSSSIIMPHMFGGSTAAAWQVRVAVVRAMCGVGDGKEVISAYLGAREDSQALVVLAKLAPDFLTTMGKEDSGSLQSLALILSELAVDPHEEIRKLVPAGAVELIETGMSEYAYRILELLAGDAYSSVRFSVLQACMDGRVEANFREKMYELFCRDASFHIRHHAEKLRTMDKEEATVF